jgi:hypothetical protein
VTLLWPEGEAVHTWGDVDAPTGFVWQGISHSIDQVCNRWRVHTRWWQSGEVLWREYWKVITDRRVLCLLYHDLRNGGWFLARLYD